MPEPLLSKEKIHGALRLLVEKLTAAAVPAQIYIVGDAALTLQYGALDATRDVDVTFNNPDRVRPCILEVAQELELPDTWLNDNVLGFISHVREDPNPVTVIQDGDVWVTVASTETLLSMKIHASRGRLDFGDIKFLLGAVGISTVKDAVALHEQYYPEDALKPQAIPMLKEILEAD